MEYLKQIPCVKAVAAAALTVPILSYALPMARTCLYALEDSERHAGTIVADVLKAHGIQRIFTLPGGHVSPVVVACEANGIRVVDTRHEADAVFAADATSRLTGTLGVAIVTAGPGVTNTITAVKNAQMAHSPLLLIGGAAATVSRGRGSLQDIEQLSLFSTIAKVSISISRVQDIAPMLRHAIQQANSGVPGPVFIELPIDLLYPILELKANMGLVSRKLKKQLTDDDVAKVIVPVEKRISGELTLESRRAYVASLESDTPVFLPAKPLSPVVHGFMTYQLKRIFGNAWVPQDISPLPLKFPVASNGNVSAVVALLSKAKKPVCIIGSQIIVNPAINNDEISAAIKSLSVPCFLSGMARGMMGNDHPYFLRQNRRGALKDADVVLLLGLSVDFRLDYGRAFSKKSKIISVNRSREELKRNTDVMWSPCMTVEADPSDFLMRLRAHRAFNTNLVDLEWVQSLKRSEKKKEIETAASGAAPVQGRDDLKDTQLINPIKYFNVVASVLDSRTDVIYIGDGGDFVGTAANIVRPNGPCTWLDPGPYGTLGCGGGFALAAKLAFPNKHVVLLYGDGSAGYSIAEFDTFARHKCPVISLVGNDACWSQIVRDQRTILGSEVGCNLAYCEYDTIALGYARKDHVYVKTIKSDGQIAAETEEALKQSTKGVSTCFNVLIGRSNFREGSISV